jgi:hypothetical protein
VELTPRDVAHWPPETRVLVDRALEAATIEDWSFRIVDAASIVLYRLLCDGQPFIWGADWELGDHEARYVGQDKDPLVGVEEFDFKQRLVPVAVPLERTSTLLVGTPRGEWRAGDWLQMERGGVLRTWEYAQITNVDTATRTITLSAPATVRQSVGMSLRRNSKRAPDPQAKPSRAPLCFTQRRLDGRRAS